MTDCRLQFGMEAPTFTPQMNNTRTIISRGISTVPLLLNFPIISTIMDLNEDTTTKMSPTTTESPTTTTTAELVTTFVITTEMSTTTDPASTATTVNVSMSSEEVNTLAYIKRTPKFSRIYDQVSEVIILDTTISDTVMSHRF